MIKKGNDAMNQVYATVSRVLNSTTRGKELVANDAHIEQKLTYYVCKDMKLICGHTDEEGRDEWPFGCANAPRAKGLCMRHFQKEYIKRVYIPHSEDDEEKEEEKKVGE